MQTKYEWEDIVIVGDSFCTGRSYSHEWPQVFACELTGQDFNPNRTIRGEGFSGCSWWSARKKLLKELANSPIKLLVFCHTDSPRLPSDKDLPLNPWFALPENRARGLTGIGNEDTANALYSYYSELFSDSFHFWAKEQFLKEVDEICLQNKINAIHFHCFNELTDFKFKSGIAFRSPLLTNAVLQAQCNNWMDYSNHFKKDQNITFGKNLANIVKQWNGQSGYISEDIVTGSNFQIRNL
jgi:hypothetical protein